MELPGLPLYRKKTRKALLDFGRYQGIEVGALLSKQYGLQGYLYLQWMYFNVKGVTFMDDILDELEITSEWRISKPGSDEEKYKKFRCVKAKEHFKEYVIDKVPEGESVSKALSVRKNSTKAARYSNYYRKEKVIMGELTPGKLAWKNQGHKKGDK